MPVELVVARAFSGRVPRERLRRIANKTLRAEHAPSRQTVTIVIVDDKEIQTLNRQFHHVDASTDVLSFSSDVKGYLGDIVISYEMARENARAVGWTIGDELELLVVHGILHLLGYDDTRPRARARMWQRQREILERELPEQPRPNR